MHEMRKTLGILIGLLFIILVHANAQKKSLDKVAAVVGSTIILQSEVIEKATEKAKLELGTKNIPKTASGFESDYNSFKKSPEIFYQYLNVRI